ncbi:hypothetical protein SSZBM1_1 [Synechococcus phage S-SZBM1]|uniref:Uncharacterized protein n=1 Tax=Synechococcus phage S-SZBM1 TaxID=2926475 RepID=A0AC61TSB9_9CAUD|nr:hypothetical protein PP650_gp001 [Synechococcus phage S-SZBM1]UNH61118.1 hypothetical protein SSZBM1_1 [Synechococcus phage S-SZBM1]
MSYSQRLQFLLDLYDEGSLPAEEQIELAQTLIDTGLNEQLTQYQRLCDYFIAEGLCYDVGYEYASE